MFRPFLGRIGRTRVRFWRERRERPEKKGKEERKMSRSGSCELYVGVWVGRFRLDPVLMFARPLDLGLGHPDQSNAPEAFWRSGSIREFGLGLFTHGFGLFHIFLVFLLCLPPVLAI